MRGKRKRQWLSLLMAITIFITTAVGNAGLTKAADTATLQYKFINAVNIASFGGKRAAQAPKVAWDAGKGDPIYCIELGVSIDGGDGIWRDDLRNNTDIDVKMLEKVIYWGYHQTKTMSSGSDWSNWSNADFSKHWATQIAVWCVSEGIWNDTSKRSAAANAAATAALDSSVFWSQWNAIINGVNASTGDIPSFMYLSQSQAKRGKIKLEYNSITDRYEKTFTDTNNVGGSYTISNSKVSIVKSGNKYTIYSTESITDPITVTAKSSISYPKAQVTWWRHNSGDWKQDTISYDRVIDDPIEGYLTLYSDNVIKGSITIEKYRDNVYAAEDSVGPAINIGARLKGATFSIYEYDASSKAYKTKAYATKTTGTSGKITFDNLPITADNLGRYRVVEDTPPTGYTKVDRWYVKDVDGSRSWTTNHIVDFDYSGIQNSEGYVEPEVQFSVPNTPTKKKLELIKFDEYIKKTTGKTELVDGAVFGIYISEQCTRNELVTELGNNGYVTVTGGQITLSNIAHGEYWLLEETTPEGYVDDGRDKEPIQVVITAGTDSKTVQIGNTPIFGEIRLNKFDRETAGRAQGDADLVGAVYGIYAKEDIIIGGNIKHKKDELVKTITIASDLTGKAEQLYLGKYYAKEIEAPEGYNLSEDAENIELRTQDNQTAIQIGRGTVLEDIIKGKIEINKFLLKNDYGTHTEPLIPEESASFRIWLTSAGSYDDAFETERDVITTNESGYAVSKDLPYGTYSMIQIGGTQGYVFANDIENIVIDKQGATLKYHLTNPEFRSQVVVEKIDVETQKIIQLPGVKFKLFDQNMKQIELGVYKQSVFEVSDGTIKDSQGVNAPIGTLLLPEYLNYGVYYLQEVEGSAPYGYLLETDPIKFEIKPENASENLNNGALVRVKFSDQAVKGSIEVYKEAEQLTSFKDGKFIYELRSLADCKFEVYAKDNIYTPDHQTNADGNRIIIYSKDQLLGTLTTDENGKAALNDLPLGSYYVKKVSAPEGYVLNDKAYDVDLQYKDEVTPIVTEIASIKNDRQKIDFDVLKMSSVNKKLLAGAAFEIHALNDVKNYKGDIIVNKGDLIETIITDQNGKGISKADIPYAIYSAYEDDFKQSEKPEVPTSNVSVIKSLTKINDTDPDSLNAFTITNNGVDVKNLIVNLGISANELKDLDISYNQDKILKNEDGTFTIAKLKEGESLTITLTLADTITALNPKVLSSDIDSTYSIIERAENGLYYHYTETIKDLLTDEAISTKTYSELNGAYVLFYIKETKAPTGYVGTDTIYYINGKLNEDSTIKVRLESITVENEPTITTVSKLDITNEQELEGAHLQILDDQTVIESWISTKETYKIYGLEAGKTYTLRETIAPDGYVTATDIQFTVKDNGSITAVAMKDDITKVKISKVDITTKKELPGAELTIKDKAGNVVEKWVSGKKPHYIEKLPVGTYTLTESITPNGYVTAQTIEFTVKDDGKIQPVVMKDDIIKVEISKKDITNKKELPGAELEIIDKDGKVIEKWTSGKKPHYIEKLPVGKYTLIEKTAPKGYLVAEKVAFEIKDTGEIQHIEMFDSLVPIEKKEGPKTGDSKTPMAASIFLLSAGTASLISKFISKKKRLKKVNN